MKYFQQIIIAVAIMALAFINGTTAQAAEEAPASDVEIISANQAFASTNMGEMLLVDIRNPDEWQRTGIPMGAKALSMYDPDFALRLYNMADRDKTRKIAVICAGGSRSSSVAHTLHRMGFENVYNVSEGVLGSKDGPGWIKQNLPMEKLKAQ